MAIETLPRELLFELDEQPLAQLVIDIVGLQERQLVRVFEVPEPVGPWRTVLVFLPRNRFTGSLPELVADTVAAAYDGERRDLATMIGASTLARISMSVRRSPDQALPDLEALGREIDELSTSWDERLRVSLIRNLGEDEGRRLYEGVGRHVPADYLGTVSPAHAIGDLRRIDALVKARRDADALDGDLSSAMVHDDDAPDDEWRFRVLPARPSRSCSPICCRCSTISVSSPSTSTPTCSTCRTPRSTSTTSASGCRADIDLTDESTAELHRAFAALMVGDVEADGFNRLILRAGLTTRDVAVLRAYAKYLRQIGFAFSQQYIESTLANHPTLVRPSSSCSTRASIRPRRRPGAALRRVHAEVEAALDAVPSLDDDRICRAFLT